MWRFVGERDSKGEEVRKVYGVLTDYDLSSWVNALNAAYRRTSQQQTWTPPYMAQELLKGTSLIHLYRHDVESLFYIVLMIASRHAIGLPKWEEEPRLIMRRSRELPYQMYKKLVISDPECSSVPASASTGAAWTSEWTRPHRCYHPSLIGFSPPYTFFIFIDAFV